jgi:hypothetical protein
LATRLELEELKKHKNDDAIIDIKLDIIYTMKESTVRTTLTLPSALLEATDQAVSAGKAKSRNQFVARAIENELAALRRAEIDAVLAEMAQAPDYQSEVLKMEAEFAAASWEALQLTLFWDSRQKSVI